jgi:hypothetical protein
MAMVETLPKQLLTAATLALSSSIPVSYAKEPVVVFYLDSQYRPVAKLERLGKISEGTKAVLAMYALQVGGGCEGHDDQGLKCELTRALGLGAQCSSQHLNLVRAWFKEALPRMTGHHESTFQNVVKSGELGSICYSQPDTATRQHVWETIRVSTEDNLVSVDAISRSIASADGPFGTNRYSTTYRIDENVVTVVSHRQVQ